MHPSLQNAEEDSEMREDEFPLYCSPFPQTLSPEIMLTRTPCCITIKSRPIRQGHPRPRPRCFRGALLTGAECPPRLSDVLGWLQESQATVPCGRSKSQPHCAAAWPSCRGNRINHHTLNLFLLDEVPPPPWQVPRPQACVPRKQPRAPPFHSSAPHPHPSQAGYSERGVGLNSCKCRQSLK